MQQQLHYGVSYALLSIASGRQHAMTAIKVCPVCVMDVNEKELKDDSAIREYRISGMCQYCQDIILREV